MSDAIRPFFKPVNRRMKKNYVKAASGVFDDLEQINSSFLHYIFNAPEDVTYLELYQMFLEEWNYRVRTLLKQGKLKIVQVDYSWFENEYKPRHNQK